MDKYSSILRKYVNYGSNRFYDIGPWWKDEKHSVTLAVINDAGFIMQATANALYICATPSILFY